MSKKTFYYHPVCHLINGRRLYFILISIKSSLTKAQTEITDIITGSDIKSHVQVNLELESQCSYFIIGETDILLKIWICEEKLAELESRFKTVDSISSHRIIIIKKTNTWYERQLTKTNEVLKNNEVNAILSREGFESDDFPTKKLQLKSPKQKKSIDSSYKLFKVWIFVNYSHSFREDTLDSIEKNILAVEDTLVDIKYISFYRYYTNSKKGLIIKADLDNLGSSLEKMFKLIHQDHPSEIEYGTTTYISQSKIRKETHDWRSINDRVMTGKKEHCIYNLMTKHDCSKNNVILQGTQNSIVDQYTRTVSDHFYTIFECFSFNKWDMSVEELRIIFKWVVFGNNKPLKSFFLGKYTQIEREYSLLLMDSYESIKYEINGYNNAVKMLSNIAKVDLELAKTALNKINKERTIFSEFLTLGNIPFVLRKINNSEKVSTSDKVFIKKLSDIFTEMAYRRNQLAHGKIDNIATDENIEDGDYIWQVYLSNYVEFVFYVKPNLFKLKAILSKTAEDNKT